MRKIIKISLIVIPSILIAIFLFFSFFINSIVKKGVETVGPKYTQTPIELKKVNISLFSGKGVLQGLIIMNPEGFKTASAFELGKITINIEPMSLFSEKVIIREIFIEGPEITYETSLKGSNIGQIKKNIESVSAVPEDEEPNGPPKEQKEKKEQKKVQIDKFFLQNGKIHLSATVLHGKTMTIPLKEIQFTDIGTESDGSFQKVIEKIFDVIFKAVIEAVKSSDKTIGKGIETLKDSTKGIEETTKEGVSKILEKMKKLVDDKDKK